MSSVTSQHPRSANEVFLTRPASEDTSRQVAAAVREAAVRATVAVGLGGIAIIHAVDSVGKWTEVRYLFWMYMALCVASIAAAGWTLMGRSRLSLLSAGALAASVIAGYVVNRTVGLPNATDDIGNWVEPLGLASLVVEGMVMAAVAAGLASRDPSHAAG